MARRLKVGESHRIADSISLYSEGAKAKLRNAEFALQSLEELCPLSDTSTSTDKSELPVPRKVEFFVDSFFAFLYSTFDVIAQVINQKLRLQIDEHNVSFKGVKKKLLNGTPQPAVGQVLDRISQSHWFVNLEKYRNCSTHRRSICINTKSLTESLTPGYSSSGSVSRVTRLLCDNPLVRKPCFSQTREVVTYCRDLMQKAKGGISHISIGI